MLVRSQLIRESARSYLGWKYDLSRHYDTICQHLLIRFADLKMPIILPGATCTYISSQFFAAKTHRNNRHRMRAPIFSQSKICLHKMAHSKGHFYSVQTPVARNFARLRGVRLFFSNTVFLKSLKMRLS